MKNRNKRIALVSAAVLLLSGYFALSPIVLASFLLYLPKKRASYDTVPLKVFGAAGEPVIFTATSGNQLHGFYFQKPRSAFTVLLHHGQGGNLSTHFGLAKTMLLAGFSVLIYDYEGFGMSGGKASNKTMLDDGIAAYKFLVNNKQIEPTRIIQCGVSLGVRSQAMSRNNRHPPPLFSLVRTTPSIKWLLSVFRSTGSIHSFYSRSLTWVR